VLINEEVKQQEIEVVQEEMKESSLVEKK